MSEALNKVIRKHRAQHQGIIEKFKSGPHDVRLVRVRSDLENTIGIHVNTDSGTVIMLGERRVSRPMPGYRYHEYKRPGRAGFAGRN